MALAGNMFSQIGEGDSDVVKKLNLSYFKLHDMTGMRDVSASNDTHNKNTSLFLSAAGSSGR